MDPLKDAHFADVIQEGLGSCYAMSALSSVALYPDLINSIFLTKQRNEAGIHAVRLFIRGKPWVIDVDDRMLYYYLPTNEEGNFSKNPNSWKNLDSYKDTLAFA